MSKAKKIALVVGHRKSKQGAYGSGGVSEYEYWGIFARDLHRLLKDERIENEIFFRQDARGYRKNMRELHKRIDVYGASHSVELHFNGSSDMRVHGHEVLYYSRAGRKSAKKLNTALTRRIDSRDRGVKKLNRTQNGYWFVKYGKSICVLSEPYFSSHQKHYMFKSNGYRALLDAYVAWAKSL